MGSGRQPVTFRGPTQHNTRMQQTAWRVIRYLPRRCRGDHTGLRGGSQSGFCWHGPQLIRMLCVLACGKSTPRCSTPCRRLSAQAPQSPLLDPMQLRSCLASLHRARRSATPDGADAAAVDGWWRESSTDGTRAGEPALAGEGTKRKAGSCVIGVQEREGSSRSA